MDEGCYLYRTINNILVIIGNKENVLIFSEVYTIYLDNIVNCDLKNVSLFIGACVWKENYDFISFANINGV